MICWIADYPMCGATLVSQMLRAAFGRYVYFNVKKPRFQLDAQQMEMLGSRVFSEETLQEFLHHARERDEWVFVKTHEHPTGDEPAIIIARDGRSACASYRHFQNHFFPEALCGLWDVILGNVAYGDWSHFYASWDALSRKDSLLLRFEDLKTRPDEGIAAMANFLGLEARGGWQDPFEEAKKAVPGFFRTGKFDDWQADFDAEQLGVFWEVHGCWMERLGYSPTKFDRRACDQFPNRSALALDRLMELFRRTLADKQGFERACVEKEACIQALRQSL